MRKIYALFALAILFSPQLNAQQTNQEYLDTFNAGVSSPDLTLGTSTDVLIIVQVVGARIPAGKSLRVIFSKNARLSGTDRVTDVAADHTNIIGRLFVDREDQDVSTKGFSYMVTTDTFLYDYFFENGRDPGESRFAKGDWQPSPGDVYYIYLTLYDSADGSGTGTTREIQIAVPARNSGTLPAKPEFAIHRLGPPEAGEANVELVVHEGVNQSTRVFFAKYNLAFLEVVNEFDATALADAADPGSGLYDPPQIVWDETGGARVSAELGAGTHYFYATNRNANGY
ncbi:MAG: hypothetical protein OXB93_02585, partial [Cytophagales bacterium]|nr:hypothetical protein [Cytophagales bacterium]